MIKQVEKQTAPRRATPLLASAMALLLLLGACYVGKVDGLEVMARKRDLPIYSVDRDDNKIAISFDAAWGGDKTEKILDILDEYGVKTTFFLVDIWTQRFPELVKLIDARGHEIGNHSTSHKEMSKQNEQEIIKELKVASDEIEKLIGKPTTLFRPPYGDYDNLVVATARQQGYQTVQWSVDSLDWKNKGVEDMISRATRNVKSGDIVLFHNDSKYIVESLPSILAAYRDKGLEVVMISELLLEGDTTIDTQGRQRKAATTSREVR